MCVHTCVGACVCVCVCVCEDISLADNKNNRELHQEGGSDAVVENEVPIGLDLEQENIQEQYHCIKLHILVQHALAFSLCQ